MKNYEDTPVETPIIESVNSTLSEVQRLHLSLENVVEAIVGGGLAQSGGGNSPSNPNCILTALDMNRRKADISLEIMGDLVNRLATAFDVSSQPATTKLMGG